MFRIINKLSYMFVILLWISILPHVNAKTAPKDTETPKRYRGFNVISLKQGILVEAAKRWGANQVRYEIIPRLWTEKGKYSDTQAWARILKDLPTGLDRAKALGLQVVVDLHEIPKFDKSQKVGKAFWHDPNSVSVLLRCWRDLLKICKDREEDIWYDLLNEPLERSVLPKMAPHWNKWAQILTDEIRKVDKHHWIVIEPGPGSFNWGFRNFKPVRGKRIIYSFHQYQPFQYTHQGIQDGAWRKKPIDKNYKIKGYPGKFHSCGSPNTPAGFWNKTKIEAEIAPVIAFQKKYNVPIWVGEFSAAPWAPGVDQCMRDNIEIFEKYNWSWAYHSLYENRCWNLDCKPVWNNTNMLSSKMTKKGKVILKYMARNGRPQSPNKYRYMKASVKRKNVSFTFDFTHPDGKNSKFSDAVALNTKGAFKDKNGKAIGFTHVTLGANASKRLPAFELTPKGLAIMLSRKNSAFAVGVPFNTTGVSSDNPVSITFYLAESKENIQKQLNNNYEQIGVGWANATAKSLGAATHVKLFYNHKKIFLTGCSKTDKVGGNPGFPMPAFGIIWGGYKTQEDNAGLYIVDAKRTYHWATLIDAFGVLDNAKAYAYLMGALAGGSAYKLTVTAIRFEGPNLKTLLSGNSKSLE